MSYADGLCIHCRKQEATRYPGPVCPNCPPAHRSYMDKRTPVADAKPKRKIRLDAPWGHDHRKGPRNG